MKNTDLARQAILARLRKTQHAAANPESDAQSTFSQAISTPASENDTERFIELLTNNHAEVIQCSQSKFSERLDEVLLRQPISKLMCSAHADLMKLLDKRALKTPFQLVDENYCQNEMFDNYQSSLCFADAGVSELGCLLVKSSPEQPRGLSLIPELNILVVLESSIYPSLSALLGSSHWPSNDLPSNLVLISGPSKTADIQQTLAYGAHGPKQLVVFILS